MATYIVFAQYTQKGVENIKRSPDRLDAVKKAFRAMGAELKEFYLVSGRYDMVVIAEAPDYETVSKLALSIGPRDSVHTETVSAFSEDEYRKIIAELP